MLRFSIIVFVFTPFVASLTPLTFHGKPVRHSDFPDAIDTSISVPFDFFVFTTEWQPEFAYGNDDPGAKHPRDNWKKQLTLHGLWPNYNNGSYPSNCKGPSFDEKLVAKITPNGVDTAYTYWPNIQYAEGDQQYSEFWDHEWTKHGTCTSMQQLEYMQTSIDLSIKYNTPACVGKNYGGTVPKADVVAGYGGSTMVALSCESNKYLLSAYQCFASEGGKPGQRQACPSFILKYNSCQDSTLSISSFQNSTH